MSHNSNTGWPWGSIDGSNSDGPTELRFLTFVSDDSATTNSRRISLLNIIYQVLTNLLFLRRTIYDTLYVRRPKIVQGCYPLRATSHNSHHLTRTSTITSMQCIQVSIGADATNSLLLQYWILLEAILQVNYKCCWVHSVQMPSNNSTVPAHTTDLVPLIQLARLTDIKLCLSSSAWSRHQRAILSWTIHAIMPTTSTPHAVLLADG